MKPVRAKKHLGQHFLKDQSVAADIVDALSFNGNGSLIEVGPGTGVLTSFLVEKGYNFQAFDVDAESIEFLHNKYPDLKDSIILGDFLKFNIREIAGPVHILGNFPYNISSQLFFQFFEEKNYVHEVVCMVQKEVGDRICSPHGSKVYGILSVLLQAFYNVEYLFTVPPHVFVPPPKVNSAVIRLTRNETQQLDCDEKLFKRVVKEGFGKRRKTLRNALKNLNLLPPLIEEKTFDLRAEQLSVSDFIELTKKIEDA